MRPRTSGAAKLLAEPHGHRPYTVTLREEKVPGTGVVLDYRQGGRRVKESLGFSVRRRDGRRWVWDATALEQAREKARDRSAGLRLDRLRTENKPVVLTVDEAFRAFNDEARGGLPASRSLRRAHIRARGVWVKWLGGDTPWNRILRSNVEALMKHYAAEESPRTGRTMIPTGLRYVEVLRACHRWLEEKAGYDDLRDPTKGFDYAGWRKKHRPSRPRYTDAEAAALLKVRHDVDPRFALYLALVDDSGARGKAIRSLWRSMLDCSLEQPPTSDQAPYGWALFRALKGQDPVLHFLTAFERREISVATDGYLSELEAAWEAHGTDYPLFPAVRQESLTGGRPVRPEQSRAYVPVKATGPRRWLVEAEKAAQVDHVAGRGYHGFRRRASDYLLEATDLKTLTVAQGWSSQATPERIYIEKRRHPDRARARAAMEEKRRDAPETPDQSVGDV